MRLLFCIRIVDYTAFKAMLQMSVKCWHIYDYAKLVRLRSVQFAVSVILQSVVCWLVGHTSELRLMGGWIEMPFRMALAWISVKLRTVGLDGQRQNY